MVTSVAGRDWTRYVGVVVPSSAAELEATLGEAAGTTVEVGALAVSDGTDPVTGVVLGQRLVAEPAQLTRLSPPGLRIVMQHEVTHLALARATTDATPPWLAEGVAEYVGNLGSGQPVSVAASELARTVRGSGPPAALPTAAEFASPSTSAQAYQSAWLACRLIASRFGVAGLLRVYRAAGSSAAGSDAAVAAALRSQLRTSPARFLSQWRSYVAARLR